MLNLSKHFYPSFLLQVFFDVIIKLDMRTKINKMTFYYEKTRQVTLYGLERLGNLYRKYKSAAHAEP